MAALGQQFQGDGDSERGHLAVVRKPCAVPPKAILQMPPCCPAQQRGQCHLHIKKKGPACVPAAGRERGDTSLVDGLRNLATGSAKPKSQSSVCKKKKKWFLYPHSDPQVVFLYARRCRQQHLPADAPKQSQPQTFSLRLEEPCPTLTPCSDPIPAPFPPRQPGCCRSSVVAQPGRPAPEQPRGSGAWWEGEGELPKAASLLENV